MPSPESTHSNPTPESSSRPQSALLFTAKEFTSSSAFHNPPQASSGIFGYVEIVCFAYLVVSFDFIL
ncbi:hypothetical protein C1H46_011646 [Malus baccata]|uniref:Uncharacterized protein n=1 Tax=Malus baccata TaxID=106549 RepID=A0A540MVE3_MALBA|nr:hypothetical protein C1H46_011646 [Malus baccata]